MIQGIPHKAEKGSIMTYTSFLTTFSSNLSEELTNLVEQHNLQPDSVDDENENIVAVSQRDLCFAAAKYHSSFYSFLQALHQMDKNYTKVCKKLQKSTCSYDLKQVFTIDGILDLSTKNLLVSNYRNLLKCFEHSIRSFEKTFIATAAAVHLYKQKQPKGLSLSNYSEKSIKLNNLRSNPFSYVDNRYYNEIYLEVSVRGNESTFVDPRLISNAHPYNKTPTNAHHDVNHAGQGNSTARSLSKIHFNESSLCDFYASHTTEKRLSYESSNSYSRKNFRFGNEQNSLSNGEESQRKGSYITPILKNKDHDGIYANTDLIRESLTREYWTNINTRANSGSQKNILKKILSCQRTCDYSIAEVCNKENDRNHYNMQDLARRQKVYKENFVREQDEAKLRNLFKNSNFFIGPKSSNASFIKLR